MNTQLSKNRMIWSLLAILLGATAAAGSARRPTAASGDGAFAWMGTAALTPSGASRFDTAADVAFDGSGNVFAGGAAAILGSNQIFTTAKWNSAGQSQWVRTVTGTGAPNGDARAIQVDPSGGLVAVGRIFNTDTRLDFAVASWDADGNPRWQRSMSGTETAFDTDQDAANAVTLDAAGDVIAVGQLEADRVDNGSMTAAAVVKLNGADGSIRWRRFLGDPISSFHSFYTVAVDSQNNLIVGGDVAGADNDSTFRIFKLAGDTGEVLWSASADDPTATGGGEQVNRVVVDAEDNVLACGVLVASPRTRFTVVKLAGSDGELLWKATPESGPGVRRGTALALAVATNGDAIAGGTFYDDGGDPDSLVIRLDGDTGAEVWAQPDPRGALAMDLVLGEGDTVITAGAARDQNGFNTPFTVRRFGADGTLLSTHALATPEVRSEARAVAIDSQGNIVAGGTLRESSGNEGAVVALIDCAPPTGGAPEVTPRLLPASGGTVQISLSAADNVGIGSVTARLTAPERSAVSGTLLLTNAGTFAGGVAVPANTGTNGLTYTVRLVVRDTFGNETELAGGEVEVPAPPVLLRVTPPRLSFGKTRVGQSKRRVITLWNAGRGPLTGEIVSPAVGFTTDPTLPPSAAAPRVPFALRRGEKKKVAVYFRPEAARRFTESLTVVLSGTTTPAATVYVSGSGTAPRQR